MKKIFYRGALCAVSVSILLAASSCDDMLTPESDLVSYPEDNLIDTSNDTLYTVVGTIRLMQKVADCTNIFGNVKGELISTTDDASVDLQEVANFSISEKNVYNRPEDYYAIINNCNYFIENADSTYVKQGERVFERDLCAIHGYRAWAYMQLCYYFGTDNKIPFYTHFIGTQEEVDKVMKESWTLKEEVFDYLINDLQPWQAVAPIDYGRIGDWLFREFWIPVRVLLGELCLWRGRYEEAARYYHDYLTKPIGNTRPSPLYGYYISYSNIRRPEDLVLNYRNKIRDGWTTSNFCYIPMEASGFSGEVTRLVDLYEDMNTYNSYYRFQLTHSESAAEQAASQCHCYVYLEGNKKDTIYMDQYHIDDRDLSDKNVNGDLRLRSQIHFSSVSSSNPKYNNVAQSIYGLYSDAVAIYSKSQIYLYYAEALNRAGYPSLAFAILKYGICDDTKSKMDTTVIDFSEFDRAGDLVYFDPFYFTNTSTSSSTTTTVSADGEFARMPDMSLIRGIHSRGCGDAAANKKYVIPALETRNDTVLWVEDCIMHELGMETLLCGHRFVDLQRIALHREDNGYLANAVATRNGADKKDEDLYQRLLQRANWYIPFQK